MRSPATVLLRKESDNVLADPAAVATTCTKPTGVPELDPTIRVKACEAGVPTPLLAVNVSEYVPAVPTPGVPLNVPVPFPLSLNVTPLGSVPDSASDGVGAPVAVTV